jgi:acyl dehydratase
VAQPAPAAKLGPAPTIEQVKFLAPVGPGQRVRIRLAEAGRGVGFEVRRGDVVVARGQLTP